MNEKKKKKRNLLFPNKEIEKFGREVWSSIEFVFRRIYYSAMKKEKKIPLNVIVKHEECMSYSSIIVNNRRLFPRTCSRSRFLPCTRRAFNPREQELVTLHYLSVYNDRNGERGSLDSPRHPCSIVLTRGIDPGKMSPDIY